MRARLFLFLTFFSWMACNQQDSTKPVSNQSPEDSQSILSIKTACALSEIAYCPNPEKELKQWLPSWKMVWNPVAVGGNYAFIATDGTIYAIGIRGSLLEFSWAAFDNWIYNDLNVVNQKDWTYTSSDTHAKISEGSYQAWENMNKLVDKTSGKNLWTFLEANVTDKNPVVLTGHSLGGNLATVYGSYLWWKWKESKHIKDNINVITFAAPAAGNKAFASDFNTEFPNSVRVENTNDIVPKFPVSDKVADLGNLYSPLPAASAILVGYKNTTVKLSTVFTMVSAALALLRITNGLSPYEQTNGTGNQITIKLSGKNNSNDITGWFAEAGYQHGIDHYAEQLGAPVISCGSQ